jgi:putative ABC transport system permease protein
VGEREPKIKWILLIVGAVSLTAGYFIALTTQNPLVAMTKFLVAVILVIIGTYALFVTGTIFVLKMLKKSRKFYYSKNHMTAVSGLLYRMKQNAVGLASITVLACGVLVMLSTTLSLYVGMQDSLAHNFPQDWYVSASYIDNDDNWVEIPLEDLASIIKEAAPVYGETIIEEHVQRYLEVAYAMDGNNLITDLSHFNSISNFGSLCAVIFVTAQDYADATGVNLTLSDGEIGICKMNVNSEDAFQETLLIEGRSYRIAETLDQFYIRSDMGNAVNCYGIVVSDENALNDIYEMQKESYGKDASSFTKRLAIKFSDRNRLFDVGDDMYRSVKTHVYDYMEQFSNKTAMGFSSDSVWETRKEMYGLYGTLLFLGMLLGIVFLFATALIIYYKQISEGYEDRERFQIMEKIGMSQSEVKASIHGQILLVFFMPLVVAGVHVAVAFQMLLKMLKLLLLSSTWAFAGCAVGAFAVFSIVYAAIYMATARTYYRIVK